MPWPSQCCPGDLTFLHNKVEHRLDVQTYRKWANMRVFLESLGIDFKSLSNGELIMVWENGNTIEPHDWESTIYEGGVVRLPPLEAHYVVYWRDLCGNLRVKDNKKYHERERERMRNACVAREEKDSG
jgi:hypothetical protein